jgi:hypothetical protein
MGQLCIDRDSWSWREADLPACPPFDRHRRESGHCASHPQQARLMTTRPDHAAWRARAVVNACMSALARAVPTGSYQPETNAELGFGLK